MMTMSSEYSVSDNHNHQDKDGEGPGCAKDYVKQGEDTSPCTTSSSTATLDDLHNSLRIADLLKDGKHKRDPNLPVPPRPTKNNLGLLRSSSANTPKSSVHAVTAISRLRGSLLSRSQSAATFQNGYNASFSESKSVFGPKNKSSVIMFDPTDPQWQKNVKFPPNKLHVWDEYRQEHIFENTTNTVNGAYLFEVTSMKEALRKVQQRYHQDHLSSSIPFWARQAIMAWFEGHYESAQIRYKSKIEYHIPLLEERFHYPQEEKDAHEICMADLENISDIIHQDRRHHEHFHHKRRNSLELEEEYEEIIMTMPENEQECLSKDIDIDLLVSKWIDYENHVLRLNTLHCNMVTLLYHAYFSPEELKDHVRRLLAKANSSTVGAIINFKGVTKFRQVVMPQENYPSIAWNLNFRKHYEAYVDNIVVHLDALKSGTPFVLAGSHETYHIVEQCRYNRRIMDKDNYIFFNPLSPIYQVSEQHLPDKLGQWKENFDDHVRSSPRYMVNKAHLAEATAMKEALIEVQKRKTLDEWEITSIRTWFDAHNDWVVKLAHFHVAEFITWVETRFHYPAILKDLQHSYVRELHRISHLIIGLKTINSASKFVSDNTRRASVLDELIKLWISYEENMKYFFDLFNRMHFTLYHAYFSRSEHLEFMCKVSAQGLPGLGPTIYHTGKMRFRSYIMKQNNLKNSWHFDFAPKYVDYVENVVVHVDALKAGIPPLTKKGGLQKFRSLFDNLSEEAIESDSSHHMHSSLTESFMSSLNFDFSDEVLPSKK